MHTRQALPGQGTFLIILRNFSKYNSLVSTGPSYNPLRTQMQSASGIRWADSIQSSLVKGVLEFAKQPEEWAILDFINCPKSDPTSTVLQNRCEFLTSNTPLGPHSGNIFKFYMALQRFPLYLKTPHSSTLIANIDNCCYKSEDIYIKMLQERKAQLQ